MSTLEIHQFPCLDDNYGYLIHDAASGLTATIDTPEVDAINAALKEKNWSLDFIFNTHHHHDHARNVVLAVGLDSAVADGLGRARQEGDAACVYALKCELLRNLDALGDAPVAVLACTNCPHALDPALRRRFGARQAAIKMRWGRRSASRAPEATRARLALRWRSGAWRGRR